MGKAIAGLVALVVGGVLLPVHASAAARLTIAEGVVVKFAAGAELVVRDALELQGEVTFTSLKDDTVGGQAGAAPGAPAPGDWGGIRVEASASTAQSRLDGAVIRFAGAAGAAGLTLRGSSLNLTNVLARDNAGPGLRVTDGATPTLHEIVLRNNQVGLEVETGAQPALDTSVIEGNTQFGARTQTPAMAVIVRDTWWGHVNGPVHPSNPGGAGDRVSDGIAFAPFAQQLPLLGLALRVIPGTLAEQPQVELRLAARTADEVRVSEDATFAGVPFGPLTPSRPFTLSSGDGMKTIFAEFRTSTGTSAQRTAQVRLDTQGPTLAFTTPADGATLNRPAPVAVTATDAAGVARVDFFVDGQFVHRATAEPFRFTFDIAAAGDGVRRLRALAVDGVGHTSQREIAVAISGTPPGAPTITMPAPGSFFNVNTLTVRGMAEPFTQVNLLLSGFFQKLVIPGPDGGFETSLLFAEGLNQLTAVALDRFGASPASSPVPVTVDAGPPGVPGGVVARALEGGSIDLSWSLTGTEVPAEYRVYRAIQTFATKAQATLVKTVPGAAKLSFSTTDLPPADGTFFYAVTAVDAAGNESAISQVVSAVSDRTPPTGRVTFNPAPPVGPGAVALTLETSEAVQGTPFLSITPAGGTPAPIELAPAGPNHQWTGTFTVTAGTAHGPATLAFGARDLTGNRGTTLTAGGTLAIDTRGPRGTIAVNPPLPVGARTVNVTLALDEAAAVSPILTFTPPAGPPIPIPLAGGPASWAGSFPLATGQGDGTGRFTLEARDLFGNVGTEILSGAEVAVDTTPPAFPAGLMAQSRPGGQVHLTWGAVAEAARYRLYRVPSAQSLALPATPVADNLTQPQATDTPPADGTFRYGVTAVDAAGNESALSADVVAVSDRTPPDAPANLALAIEGPAVRATWTAPGGEAPASYNLYRSTSQITTLAGLTPVATGLTATTTLHTPPADGTFFFAVAAVDAVGNVSAPSNSPSILFDQGAPQIAIAGVSDGQITNQTVRPVITVTDAALGPVTITLNGQPFASGTDVTAEGDHVLFVDALDTGGRRSTTTVRFTIDKTPPDLQVTGVADGARLEASVTPVISATDAHLDRVTATLNGQPFESGTPITADNAYTLVARATDRAGNATQVTVAFEIDAAPPTVASLEVQIPQGAFPTLAWPIRPEADVVGYHVYRNGVRQTAAPQAANLFEDRTFDDGSVNRYRVTVVDRAGHEGPPREVTVRPVRLAVTDFGITLPGTTAQVLDPITRQLQTVQTEGGKRLTRRYLDRARIDISNRDAQALDLGPLDLTLQDRFGVTFAASAPGPLAVGPGATLGLDQVLPTGLDIDDARTLGVTLRLPSEPDTLVQLRHTATLQVREAPVKIEIFNEPLIRGGQAKVSLKIYNQGSVGMQVLTSLNNAASPEVLVRLKDREGNVLAQGNLDHRGAGVRNFATHALADVAPGGGFLSKPVLFTVPGTAPDDVVLEGVVTAIHSAYGQPGDVQGNEIAAAKPTRIVSAAYLATAFPERLLYDQGTPVVITGQALDTFTNQPKPNVPVKVGISLKGFVRFLFATTDDQGNYTTTFEPLPVEAGIYKLWGAHPDVIDRLVQSEFTIVGLTLDPSRASVRMSKNSDFSFPLKLKNVGETPLTGLTFAVTGGPGMTGSVEAGGATAVAPGATAEVRVQLHAAVDAPDASSATLTVGATEGGITRQLDISLALSPAIPVIDAPGFIELSLTKGSLQTRQIKVRNTGFAPLENIRIDPPQTPWMGLTVDPAGIPPVPPGGETEIGVIFRPPPTTEDGQYGDRFIIRSGNHIPFTVNIFATLTSSQEGNVHFFAKDILNELVPEARITVRHELVPTLVFTGFTNAQGELTLNGLPTGRYIYQVQAPGHVPATGNFVVQANLLTEVSLLLDVAFVSLEWRVTPIVIEDRYEIKLEATFRTDVPAPVLTSDPPRFDIPMDVDSTFEGEYTITNHGLIAVDDVKFSIRSSPGVTLEIPFDFLPRIRAKEKIKVPFRVTLHRFKSPIPNFICENIYADIAAAGQYICPAGVAAIAAVGTVFNMVYCLLGGVVSCLVGDICNILTNCKAGCACAILGGIAGCIPPTPSCLIGLAGGIIGDCLGQYLFGSPGGSSYGGGGGQGGGGGGGGFGGGGFGGLC